MYTRDMPGFLLNCCVEIRTYIQTCVNVEMKNFFAKLIYTALDNQSYLMRLNLIYTKVKFEVVCVFLRVFSLLTRLFLLRLGFSF